MYLYSSKRMLKRYRIIESFKLSKTISNTQVYHVANSKIALIILKNIVFKSHIFEQRYRLELLVLRSFIPDFFCKYNSFKICSYSIKGYVTRRRGEFRPGNAVSLNEMRVSLILLLLSVPRCLFHFFQNLINLSLDWSTFFDSVFALLLINT